MYVLRNDFFFFQSINEIQRIGVNSGDSTVDNMNAPGHMLSNRYNEKALSNQETYGVFELNTFYLYNYQVELE